MLNNLKMVKALDRAVLFTMADQQKVKYGLSNGTIFSDLKQLQIYFSRLCHSLMLND